MKKLLNKIAFRFLLQNASAEQKQETLTELVKGFYNTISVDDILKINPDGTLQFEGKTLDASYRKDLREQAKLLESLLLWKVIQKDIQYHLNRKMYLESKVGEDVLWGQLLTFLFDIIKTRISRLKN